MAAGFQVVGLAGGGALAAAGEPAAAVPGDHGAAQVIGDGLGGPAHVQRQADLPAVPSSRPVRKNAASPAGPDSRSAACRRITRRTAAAFGDRGPYGDRWPSGGSGSGQDDRPNPDPEPDPDPYRADGAPGPRGAVSRAGVRGGGARR